ncbi:and other transporter-domain-containing protein [Kockovaella imperatae]|uniref:And other transporter-domain-containing protein n=1 Tax=Kockovaella imperatae TaxID=4999 RepID=A0A1Y1UJB8_9TREE|nr:and other transporter-domain-containing protein [Kockovaella imperatae]ORX38153.1 and other transporter-domain-containing protein [Kockovaella imperatae]
MPSHQRGEHEKHLSEEVEETHTATDVVTEMSANELLQAYNAAVSEHQLSIRRSARIGVKAIAWMSVIGLVSIVDRLNETLLFGFQALPSFQKEFGAVVTQTNTTLKWTLTAKQQELLNVLPGVAHILGLAIYGYLVDRLGTLVLVVFAVFLAFFAHNFAMVLAGTTLNNAILAFVSAIAPAWCLELSPLALRPYALIYMQFVQNIAQLIASVMCQSYANSTSRWAWRIPYAIQWGFPIPVIIATWFAPESPWWLVRHGQNEAALRSLARLHNGENDDDQMLALIQYTVVLERALAVGGTYGDVFKGVNLRRTEVAFMSSLGQNLAGFALAGGTYFFEAAGLSASNAFSLSCGSSGLSMVATILAAVVIKKMGRRGLWLGGTAAMCIILAVMGSLALARKQTPAVVWPQGVCAILFNFFDLLSLGALASILTAEIGAVNLRRKTQAVGLIGYDVSALVSGAISPYLVNPDKANLKGKAAWIPCFINILLFIYGYFRIPEIQGRNSEELDILFERRVPARQFKRYKIDREEEFGLRGLKDTGCLEPANVEPVATLV